MEKFDCIDDIHRRIFAAMLGNLDDSVGAVLGKLRQAKIEEQTLVFFISDNGGPTRELTSSNLPLRGGKGDVYEGGIRVPFLLQWKSKIPAGVVYPQPVISLDVYATAAAVAGAPIPPSRSIDGVNLMPFLTGQRDGRPHDVLFWRMNQKAAVRLGDWKLVRNSRRASAADWQLYNLAEDTSESTNLAGGKPTKLQELKEAWVRLNGQMLEPDRGSTH
jgi:arylsulfatase B